MKATMPNNAIYRHPTVSLTTPVSISLLLFCPCGFVLVLNPSATLLPGPVLPKALSVIAEKN